MGEPVDLQCARSRAAEPTEGADDGPRDDEPADDPAQPPTVETIPVDYPSHYLDPPPETVIWA